MNDVNDKSKRLLNYINGVFSNDEIFKSKKTSPGFDYNPGENEALDSMYENMSEFESLDNNKDMFNHAIASNIEAMKILRPDVFPTINTSVPKVKQPRKIEPKAPENTATEDVSTKPIDFISPFDTLEPTGNQMIDKVYETGKRHVDQDIASGKIKEEDRPIIYGLYKKLTNGIVNRKTGQIEFDIFDLLDNKNSLMKEVSEELKLRGVKGKNPYLDSINHMANSMIKHHHPSKEEYEKLQETTINALSDQLYSKFKIELNNYPIVLETMEDVFESAAEKNMSIKEFALSLGETFLSIPEVEEAVTNLTDPELLNIIVFTNAALVNILGQGASIGFNKERSTDINKLRAYYKQSWENLKNEELGKSYYDLDDEDDYLDLLLK